MRRIGRAFKLLYRAVQLTPHRVGDVIEAVRVSVNLAELSGKPGPIKKQAAVDMAFRILKIISILAGHEIPNQDNLASQLGPLIEDFVALKFPAKK